MKIVNCFFGKSRGGIEVVTVQYASAIQKLGHQSEIFTLKNRNYSDYIRHSRIPCRYMISRGLNPISVLWFIGLLYISRPDVVFLHGTKAVEFGTCFCVRLLFPRTRFVGVTHGILSNKYQPLKYIVTITNYLKIMAEKLNIPHRYLLYNTTPAAAAFAKGDQRNETIVIGTCGRDSPVKGYDTLLKALGELKKRHLPFHCLVAGQTGEKYRALTYELGIGEDVTFLGWIDDKDSFYGQLDIYVSASTLEPFGLTLIEAMMREKAVIATDCDGPKEILTDSSGLLIPRHNPIALADALQELITNPKKRAYLAQNGRIRALEHFCDSSLPNKMKPILTDITTTH
ncbi:MAG: glycosyltransferase family 4 protein [Alphaproteobacteria bacterium]